MPFKSKSQQRACYAKRDAGTAKGWNCDEWAHATKSIKKLPEHKKKAMVELEKRAGSLPELLGIRAAVLHLEGRR